LTWAARTSAKGAITSEDEPYDPYSPSEQYQTPAIEEDETAWKAYADEVEFDGVGRIEELPPDSIIERLNPDTQEFEPVTTNTPSTVFVAPDESLAVEPEVAIAKDATEPKSAKRKAGKRKTAKPAKKAAKKGR